MNYSEFERGLLLGVFSVQGSFGGDGRTPQLIIRGGEAQMQLFKRLLALIPESTVHGPYNNRGSIYYQWSLRGEGLFQFVATGALDGLEALSPAQWENLKKMSENYFREGGLRFRVRRRRAQIEPESQA